MSVTLETQLENYTLEQEIGRGDLTIVYQAHRKSDDALVAVKIVPPQFTFDQHFVRRFQDMAQQAVKLEHPNIVRTYETGQEDDVLFVVREFIQARPLSTVIAEEGPFPPERMLLVAQQITSALDYAHQKSIMHGDLSSSRVYLGPNDYTILADFGQTQAMAGTSLVKQGFAIGSPETTAPERVHGQSPSRQSDLYSMGILCYQMLVGEPPFKGSPTAVLHAQAYEHPRPLHLVNPAIPVPLSEAVGRMLAKGSELRYNTGAEFARALAMAAKGTAPMRDPTTAVAQLKAAGLNRTPFWKRRWLWGLVALGMIALLSIIGFGAVSLWNMQQTNTSPAAVAPPVATSSPTPLPAQPAANNNVAAEDAANTPASINEATNEAANEATNTPSPLAETVLPTEAAPTVTNTLIPFPTPGRPTIAENSPFTNLILAHEISEANVPLKVGVEFAPGPQPLYLFFDYANIEPGTPWTHRWTWGDTELDSFPDVWSDNYSRRGTAWVFYNPGGGFQPGPYKVTLEIDGTVVATGTFVIEAGGL